MTWHEAAACRLEDATLFDQPGCDTRNPREIRQRIAAAQAICARCPVRTPCLLEGRADRAHGIRGGLLLHGGRPDNRYPLLPLVTPPRLTAARVMAAAGMSTDEIWKAAG